MSVWQKLCDSKVYFSAQASFAGSEVEFDESKKGKCIWRVLGSGVPVISETDVTVTIDGNNVTIDGKKFVYDEKKNELKGESYTFSVRNF